MYIVHALMCSWASLFSVACSWPPFSVACSCAPLSGSWTLLLVSCVLMHYSLSWAPLLVACWATELSVSRFLAPISVVCSSTPTCFALLWSFSVGCSWATVIPLSVFVLLSPSLCLVLLRTFICCAPQSTPFLLCAPECLFLFVSSWAPLPIAFASAHLYMSLVYMYSLSFVCSWVPLSKIACS